MAVRSGPWKLAIAPQSIGMGMREQPEDIKSNLRLYNLDSDIREMVDVAAQNPQVVASLQKLAGKMIADIGSGKPGPGVRPAGTVENPVTLFPSIPRNRPTRAKGKPINWKMVEAGKSYPSASAPAIAGKPFSIETTIEAESPEGVIVSHGGSAVGYSLYAHDGEIIFCVACFESRSPSCFDSLATVWAFGDCSSDQEWRHEVGRACGSTKACWCRHDFFIRKIDYETPTRRFECRLRCSESC